MGGFLTPGKSYSGTIPTGDPFSGYGGPTDSIDYSKRIGDASASGTGLAGADPLAGTAADMARRYAAAKGRAAPTMTGASAGSASMVDPTRVNMGEDSADAAGQEAYMRRLALTASGGGPSAGSAALWKGYGSTMAGNLAALSSGPQTGPVGAGLRGYADTAMAGAATIGNEAAMAREQERVTAMGQLGGLANAYRASSLGMARDQAGLNADAAYGNANAANQFGLANAGFDQAAREQNLGAYLAQQGLNSSMLQSMFNGGKDIGDFDRNTVLGRMGDWHTYGMQNAAAQQAIDQNNFGTGMKIASSMGGMATGSDRKLKRDIEPADDELAAFLASLEHGR